jgi:hypothetical protein
MESDSHSALAAVAPSATWRLIHALGSLRDRDSRVLIAGFYDGVRTPSEAERKAIAEQGDAMEEQARVMLGLKASLDNVTGAAYRERISFAPTANVAGIHGGRRARDEDDPGGRSKCLDRFPTSSRPAPRPNPRTAPRPSRT